jgi:hypothetical protein
MNNEERTVRQGANFYRDGTPIMQDTEPRQPQGPPFPPPLRRNHAPRNSPIVDRQSSAWERELNKMIGRQVTVTQYVGTSDQGLPLYIDHVGVCVAMHFTHLSIVLMTDEEKIVLKNVSGIRRKRTKNNAPKPVPEQLIADRALGELTKVTNELSVVLGEALKGAPE